MSQTLSPRIRLVALIAIFAWTVGLLTGALLAVTYGRVSAQQDPQVSLVVPTQASWPSPDAPVASPASPIQDCPARKYWSSCDPIPRNPEDLEKALMSPPESLGWLDIAAKGWGTIKVDGIFYGQFPSKNRPIIPGKHVIDFFDYGAMRHARCDIDIAAGRGVLVLVGSSGNCVISDATEQVMSRLP